jgi:hypothetical protein
MGSEKLADRWFGEASSVASLELAARLPQARDRLDELNARNTALRNRVASETAALVAGNASGASSASLERLKRAISETATARYQATDDLEAATDAAQKKVEAAASVRNRQKALARAVLGLGLLVALLLVIGLLTWWPGAEVNWRWVSVLSLVAFLLLAVIDGLGWAVALALVVVLVVIRSAERGVGGERERSQRQAGVGTG